jgi:trehalose synthase
MRHSGNGDVLARVVVGWQIASGLQEASMEKLAPTPILDQPSLLERYQELIGIRATKRVLEKARALAGLKVLHVNSTRQGGGVAEILSSLIPLMNDVGIETDWLVIDGSPEFFAFTKDIHNGLHGEPVGITPATIRLHRDVVHTNGTPGRLDRYDIIVVHDPQPLPLVELRRQQGWIWCCHIDLSAPFAPAWDYLAPTVERYDTAVFSLPEYAQPLGVPQRFIMPAIDPFSSINREISRAESTQHLQRYCIPRDLPLVVQAGRFDKWKDPQGVIDAFRAATQRVAATLVLVGNTAADDPEGPAMYETLCTSAGERIMVIAADDPLLVNTLQRRAAVVLQKSLREGFGLTVSEAMWKGRAVIGGDVGGVRHQIVHGQTGYLVSDVDQAAAHIATLLLDPGLRRNVGRRARERVRRHFLLTRLLEEWIDLIAELALTRRAPVSAQEPAAVASR